MHTNVKPIARDNIYPAQRTPPPYLTFPSWWRSFVFRVLSPRELSVYLYLASMFNEKGTAFPLKAQIAKDLGVKNRAIVDTALDGLVDKGFMLREGRTISRGNKEIKRIVYQRPSIEHTLLTLLEAGLIDADLMPLDEDENEPADFRRHESAVILGLKSLTGMREAIERYRELDNKREKSKEVRRLLAESQARKRMTPIQF
jgi:hypothetical protein